MAVILGHDVSHHQAGVDVSRLAGRFIIARTAQAKGGQYSTTRDGMYATHKANARRGGKIFGSYFYLGNGLSAADNAALHASIEPDRGITVMLDWEAGSGNVAFLRACRDEFVRLGYTINLTYAPQWYLNGAGGGGSLAGLPPLCSSKYASTVPGTIAAKLAQVSASYWAGYGGNSVAVLQFSSVGRDAAYPGTNLDCLAFGGTDAQLAALFSTRSTPAVPAAPTTAQEAKVAYFEDTQGKLKNITLGVPTASRGKTRGLVIGQGWVSSYWVSVKFSGPTLAKGPNIVKVVFFDNGSGPFEVAAGRSWEIDVPTDAVTAEVEYRMTVPALINGVARDVVGSIEFV
jgi:hypothetical protein